MKIKQTKIKLRDIYKGYKDLDENGVFSMDGKLNIRPAYQREFVYKDKQREAVIETIMKGFPLSSMYWSKNADGSYEVMDGQQRTISACQYINGDFSVEFRKFHNLTEQEKNEVLDYEFDINVCEGSEVEKLEWFEVINIAGEKLTQQELRNAIYTGAWLADAKSKFSKRECPAYKIGAKYLKGSAIRQDYLETALKWICKAKGIKDVEEYMSSHQKDSNADELWDYFVQVIDWVKRTFVNYNKLMKGLDWGKMYDYATKNGLTFSSSSLEVDVDELIADEEVTNKKGAYEYLILGTEKSLNVRGFSDGQKIAGFNKCGGVCNHCNNKFEIKEMEADHIKPWSKGGKTNADNLQMLCIDCNRTKGGK